MGSWGAGAFENDDAQVLLANLAHWGRGAAPGYGRERVSRQLRILFGREHGGAPPGPDTGRGSQASRAGDEESGAGDAQRLTAAALVIARAIEGTESGGELREQLNPGLRPDVLNRLLRVRRPPGQVSDWLESASEHCDLIRYKDATELLPAVILYLKSRRAHAAAAADRSCEDEIGNMLAAAEFCDTIKVD